MPKVLERQELPPVLPSSHHLLANLAACRLSNGEFLPHLKVPTKFEIDSLSRDRSAKNLDPFSELQVVPEVLEREELPPVLPSSHPPFADLPVCNLSNSTLIPNLK